MSQPVVYFLAIDYVCDTGETTVGYMVDHKVSNSSLLFKDAKLFSTCNEALQFASEHKIKCQIRFAVANQNKGV